uniref:Uncharacterized protein n=1 Tax=Eptatretus burgeri TaxID=7764 RepID=A0A8C4N8C8_EPTBU
MHQTAISRVNLRRSLQVCMECPIPKRWGWARHLPGECQTEDPEVPAYCKSIRPLLSPELQRFNMSVGALSEFRRRDSGEIMAGGYTYYWSGHSDGYHAQGIAVAVSNKLTPMIIEVTPVNERVRMRIHYSLGVIFLVSVYASNEVSNLIVKEAFYGVLESVVGRCPSRYSSNHRGISMHRTGTDRDGMRCIGLHWSGTGNQNRTKFLDFARSRGLNGGGPWFQCRQAHRWTWYSKAGGVAKEIEHVLVVGRWRMIQNSRVYQSALFLNTDHRFVVATLKLQIKSRRMVPSQPRLDVGKLKDERGAEEFVNRLSMDLGREGKGVLGNAEELWSTFKTSILDVDGGYLGTHCQAKNNFVAQETLDTIDQSQHQA